MTKIRTGEGLNSAAHRAFQKAASLSQALRIHEVQLDCGTKLLDFGVHTPGGLEAGRYMASICMAGLAHINIVAGDRAIWPGPWVQVATDFPLDACMLSQYAGWPVKQGDFFAMGSGAMRVRRGREELLKSLLATDSEALAVGTLECDQLPSIEVAEAMAAECHVQPHQLFVAVAPTRSVAGCVQVVARSIETSLHKLHELGFPLERVHSGYGLAPVPTATPNFALGIGRTNDAILYAGHVTLWVDGEDSEITEVGRKLPSSASADFGEPFAKIFKRYEYDFYKVDPGLFSPAEITLVNLKSGNSWRFGAPRADIILRSFGTQLALEELKGSS